MISREKRRGKQKVYFMNTLEHTSCSHYLHCIPVWIFREVFDCQYLDSRQQHGVLDSELGNAAGSAVDWRFESQADSVVRPVSHGFSWV
jgi:hypothetical protein